MSTILDCQRLAEALEWSEVEEDHENSDTVHLRSDHVNSTQKRRKLRNAEAGYCTEMRT